MEPDWSNVDAAKRWLESRYPNSNNQTGSPLYRYLKDELSKGHKLQGRETHLSPETGGEFFKFVFEKSKGNAVCYPSMRKTFYPVKDYPQFVVPPDPDTDEEECPKVKPSKKPARPGKPKSQRKKSAKPPESGPIQAERRPKKPSAKGRITDKELIRIQEERLKTLRKRENGKVCKSK